MTTSLRAAIKGIGAAVPEKVLTNADFEKFLDTSDEWITQRTGIKERHICTDDESTSTLAVKAAKQALQNASVNPEDLDLIVCGTVSPDMSLPSAACLVQHALGATKAAAFDLGAACSGFIYSLITASQFIETGKYRKVLVVGVDTLSKYCDYEDRGSCILFGDGAGAVVLEPTSQPDKGIVYGVMHSDGSGWDFIHVPAGGTQKPATHQTVDAREHFVKMRGRDVYKFAVDKMQWLLGDCMEKTGMSVDDVDMVVPHQVNTRIIDSATSKFGFPTDKIYLNIEKYGNTSGASVPLALSHAWEEGKIKEGSNVILVAFGAGLTWAGAVVKF